MNWRSSLVRIAFVQLVLIGATFAQTFKYVAINYPGALYTQANGINSAGETVGAFQTDPNCSPFLLPVTGCATHGYKLVNGVFTEFDIPNAIATQANGVNNSGDIVGTFTRSDQTVHGFLLKHTGPILEFDFPGTGGINDPLSTVPIGINVPIAINKPMMISGMLYSVFGQNPLYGFTWNPAGLVFTKIDENNGQGTGIWGISNLGVLVGQMFNNDFDFWNGLLIAPGDTDVYSYQADTTITGVNDSDDIVGFSNGGFFSPTVEVENTETNEPPPTRVSVAFPNASFTRPRSINNQRMIVGTYGDNNGWHGFMAVPQ